MIHTQWETGFGDGITGARCAPHCYLDDTGTAAIPIRQGRRVIAWVLESLGPSGSNPEPTAEMKDDARLIAAAPDLLEALKFFAKCMNHGAQSRGLSDSLQLAKAAIAKAEGA